MTVPPAWHDQLAEGGLLELPLSIQRAGQAQAIVPLRKQGERLRSQALLYGGFMPLREAPGGPVPSPPPNLSATERIDDRSRPLAHLSGEALRRLSAPQRQRLLSLALSEPRTRALGLRAPRLDLALYLMIEAPEDRFLGGGARVGVIGENGGGLALLAGGKTLTRIESYGEKEAERLLLKLIEGWKERGRPRGHDLEVEVSPRGAAGSEVRLRWST